MLSLKIQFVYNINRNCEPNKALLQIHLSIIQGHVEVLL